MQLFFIHKQQESDDVWTFFFKPTAPFAWIAGQSLRLEIAGPYGALEHRFSISSAPHTGIVGITTRLTDSDYKLSLDALQPGDTAYGHGVEGNFVWRTAARPHIFVAAGIGITPFRPMIAERIAQKLSIPATLLYSSHDEPLVYGQELEAWQRSAAELKIRPLPNQRITAAHILDQPHAYERFIYISGPSKMVDTLSADLLAAGVTPAQMLRDQFTGRLPLDG